MWLFLQSLHQRTPIANAVVHGAQQINVGGRSQQAILQVLSKTIINSERDDERSNSGCNSSDRNSRDYAYNGLLALGAQIPRCDKKFEAHGSYQPSAISLQPNLDYRIILRCGTIEAHARL